MYKRAMVIAIFTLGSMLATASSAGPAAADAQPNGGSVTGVTTSPVYAPAGTGSAEVQWSASCDADLWSVNTDAYHQDGSHANHQSTAEPRGTHSDSRTHSFILTMAKGLQEETFQIKVVLTCYPNGKALIGEKSVTLTRKKTCRVTSDDFKLSLKPSTAILDYIKRKELPEGTDIKPKHLVPYEDANPTKNADGTTTKHGHCTIGWGHLIHYHPCDGQASETGAAKDISGHKSDYANGLTKAQAQALFDQDIAERVAVMRGLINFDLNQNQYDALFDLFFNHGYGCTSASCWDPSDLIEAINCGDLPHVLRLMLDRTIPGHERGFIYSDGKVDAGLVTRRAEEVELFQRPVAQERRAHAARSRPARRRWRWARHRAAASARRLFKPVIAASAQRTVSGAVVAVHGSGWGTRAEGCGAVTIRAYAPGESPYRSHDLGRTSKRVWVKHWKTPTVAGRYDWLVDATQRCGTRTRLAGALVNLRPR